MPPFAIMRVTAVVPPSDPTSENMEIVYFKCDIPNSYGDGGYHFVNGPCRVKDQNFNKCTRGGGGCLLAAYDPSGSPSSGTPAFGQHWGPQPNSWKMNLNSQGFFCLGQPTNTTQNIALFQPQPWTVFRGVVGTIGGIAGGATGLVSIYYRTGATAYSYAGAQVTAFNALDGRVNYSGNVWCQWQDYIDWSGDGLFHSGWSIFQSDC